MVCSCWLQTNHTGTSVYQGPKNGNSIIVLQSSFQNGLAGFNSKSIITMRIPQTGKSSALSALSIQEVPDVRKAGWEVLLRITSRLGDCMSTSQRNVIGSIWTNLGMLIVPTSSSSPVTKCLDIPNLEVYIAAPIGPQPSTSSNSCCVVLWFSDLHGSTNATGPGHTTVWHHTFGRRSSPRWSGQWWRPTGYIQGDKTLNFQNILNDKFLV